MTLATRRWLPLLLLAALGLMASAAARPAHAKTVDLTGSTTFVYPVWSIPTPPADPNRCVAYTFLEFPDVPGATAYSATVSRASNGEIQHWGPALADEYRVTSGSRSEVFSAPPGKHRIGPLSAYSVGSGCGDALAGVSGAWNLVSLTAEVTKARYDLSGTVTGCPDDKPLCDTPGPLAGATVTATSSAGATSTATDAAGRYTMTLDEDAYTVTAALGERRFRPSSRVVALSANTDGIDFEDLARFRVTGTITACKPDDPCTTPLPVPGAAVNAAGTSPGQAVTDELGRYTLELPKGTYTISARLQDAVFEPPTRKVVVNKDLAGQDFRTCTEDGTTFTNCSSLAVTVTPRPAKLVLKQTADRTVPQDVVFTVTIRNRSKKPIHNVTLNPKLVIGYVGGAHTGRLPLRPRNEKSAAAAKDVELGTLRPGQVRKQVLQYVAYGDGLLDARAIVLYSVQPRSRTLDTGATTTVEIQTPALYVSLVKDRQVRSPNSGKLVQAGTAFSVRVRIENRSWTKQLLVVPLTLPEGNAHGGHWQPPKKPIQLTDFAAMGVDPPTLPPQLELAPREKLVYDVVYFSMAGDARKRSDEPGEQGRRSGGGTRATVHLARPLAFVEDPYDAESWRPALPSEVLLDPERRVAKYSLDDKAPDVAPFSPLLATANFSYGVVKGCVLWVGAGLHGVGWLIGELPALMIGGLLEVPTQVRKFTEYQAELWHAVRADPATKGEYGAAVVGVLQRNYDKILELDTRLIDGIDQEVYKHYEAMHNDWYAGDWEKASTEFGVDAAQRTLDIAAELVPIAAPAVLARFPKAAAALETFKAAAQSKAQTALAAVRFRPTSQMIVQVLGSERMAWGTPLSEALAEQLLGMKPEEYRWATGYFKGKNRLWTVRARAREALNFPTAVYKPEQFKIGSVDWIDVEYLNYQYADMGTLVIREPPTRAEVKLIQGILRKEGKKPGNRIYDAVMKKIQQRQFEWSTNEEQYVKSLQAWAEKGEVDFKFNWRDNLIDPNAAPPEPSQLAKLELKEREARPGVGGRKVREWEVGVDPERTGTKYERVVGDTDGTSLTEAGGFALDDAEMIAEVNVLRASPFKIRHPFSADWQKDGKFVFPAKLKFLNAGIQAQIGPDGVWRLVRFDEKASKLVRPGVMNLRYEGGVVY
jgi:hypothetical protein